MNKIKKCTCGSIDFIVNEGLTHKAQLGDDGVLSVYKCSANEIELVECAECGKEFNQKDFKSIEF